LEKRNKNIQKPLTFEFFGEPSLEFLGEPNSPGQVTPFGKPAGKPSQSAGITTKPRKEEHHRKPTEQL